MYEGHVVHCVYILPHQVPLRVVCVRILASVFGYLKHAEIGNGNDHFQHVHITVMTTVMTRYQERQQLPFIAFISPTPSPKLRHKLVVLSCREADRHVCSVYLYP